MRALLLSVFSAFLLTLSAANAGQLWTATGSTGTIDPAVISIATIGTSSVGFSSSSSSTTPITVRYNVTLDDTTAPTWTTLEILANNANVTNGVIATLYSVNRSNGTVTLIASVGSAASASTQAFTGAIGTSTTFDFTNNYYVVKAILSRASSTAFPTLQGVRLY
ncbi:MAG TPA: hypothetical protein VF173_22470 [Thermoanaerobaculia bacterium]|nr:hypothetical protein [Thermoanaerobaculia bacterium]